MNIRKLPAGHKASENAITLTQQWGFFDLKPGETFARHFFQEVFVRRQG